MEYISTRGKMKPIGFQEAVLMGLASDGGLVLPTHLPDVSAQFEAWKALSYPELAFEVISLFATDIPEEHLRKLIEESYATFTHAEVTPSVSVGDVYILELFHGPTLAFKDVALQLLGNLFSYILEQQGGELNILGATSGDTGSAAIEGVRGKSNINIFMMYPAGRTSPIQEKQMTSVLDDNVYNIALDGTFDDCQYIMKTLFADVPYKQQYHLGAVNSVNWARVLAQMVYYFYAGFRVMEQTKSESVRFAVPTGNFGDILAGYLAKQMGLPVSELLLATNENDILTRFFSTGTYGKAEVVSTISPSMDIQVASNFERYLYYRLDADSEKVASLMEQFKEQGSLSVEKDEAGGIDPLFRAIRGGTPETLEVISRYYEQYAYVLDPHTALGVYAAESAPSSVPTICLATAHPAKFTETIERAIGCPSEHPKLASIKEAPTRSCALPNEVDAIRAYVSEHV